MMERELLQSALSPSPECLSAEVLQTLLDSGKAESSNAAALHLGGCPRCQAEVAMLRAFTADQPLENEGAAVAWISAQLERKLPEIKGGKQRVSANPKERPWWSRWWSTSGGRLAFAATALAAVAIAASVWMRPAEPTIVADAGGHEVVMRSEEIAGLAPVGDVNAKPTQLHWNAVPQGVSYRVDVMEVDGSILWTGQITEIFVTLPQSLRAKMLKGKPMLWRVTAFDSGGKVSATSQLERFRVLGPSVASGADGQSK